MKVYKVDYSNMNMHWNVTTRENKCLKYSLPVVIYTGVWMIIVLKIYLRLLQVI